MKRILFFLPAGLYYGLIFFLSSQSFEVEVEVSFLDKGVHFLEFAVLGVFLAFGFFLGLESTLRVKSVFTVVTGFLLAGLDELHQYFVPLRSMEALDLVADAAGILCGLGISLYLMRTRKGQKLLKKVRSFVQQA